MNGEMITSLVFFIIGATLLAIAIVLIIVGIFKNKSHWSFYNGDDDIYGGLFLGVFALVIGIPGCSRYFYLENTYEKCFASEIYSMSLSSTDHQFTLGLGTDDNLSYYFYYEKIGSSQYKLNKLNASYSFIIEIKDNSRTPCIWEVKERGIDPYYNIYVPVGTTMISVRL